MLATTTAVARALEIAERVVVPLAEHGRRKAPWRKVLGVSGHLEGEVTNAHRSTDGQPAEDRGPQPDAAPD